MCGINQGAMEGGGQIEFKLRFSFLEFFARLDFHFEGGLEAAINNNEMLNIEQNDLWASVGIIRLGNEDVGLK